MNSLFPQEAYNELAYYTLSHKDPAFIHQHVVDAFAAQYADESTKLIKILFALIGLYLYLEKGYTGKQVQLAHMQIAKEKKDWPKIKLPEERGNITVFDVVNINPGEERDRMIKKWCQSVWEAYSSSREIIIDFLKQEFN